MNKNNPKVTVRMSAYNHEAYIEQAILSIVNQTYQDFELLVIDDGSTDQTPEILERLSQEYGFYFERQQNMGCIRTLNKLIAMAKGEYLAGCASDDFWPLTRLEEQVNVLERKPSLDAVHGCIIKVDSLGDPIAGSQTDFKRLLTGSRAFSDLISRRRIFYAGTLLIRKSLFDQVGGYDPTLTAEDYDWMLRMLKVGKVEAIDKVWHYYRQHSENWSKTRKGVHRIVTSEFRIAKKLGLKDGSIFLYHTLPQWFEYSVYLKSRYRYLFVMLWPLWFWKKRYAVLCFHALVSK